MGKYNSSTYRVVPLVEAIKCNQRNFDLFLSSVHSQKVIPNLLCPADDNAYFYGDDEKQLNPPKEHLMNLVKYIASKKIETFNVGSKRAYLYGFKGNEKRKAAELEALHRIDKTYTEQLLPKAWYIFEGATNPDIYIEGEDYIIVCEGKWTESHITTKTTHLKAENENRNQMIRHIQGVLNSTDKTIYAFYIVDANCNYIGDLTEDAFKTQLDMETIKPNNKEAILSAFYGYTTWQELEEKIDGLNFLTKEQIDCINS